MLGTPDPLRLLLLTFHPFRGLFDCSPVLLAPLLGWPRPLQLRALRAEQVVPLAIIAFFVLFNLSFNGWHGGWNVGPRYLILMLPFLFSVALAGLRREARLSAGLALLSTFEMFSVAAVQLMVPDVSQEANRPIDPIAYRVRRLFRGELSASSQSVLDLLPTTESRGEWASYNLGEQFGLRGVYSLVPAAALVLLVLGVAQRAAVGLFGLRDSRPSV
jgi:hypothetical protein